jgi:PH (Pleckstrin Homology) domain-containing protein
VVWWLWVAFAVGNLIDIAVQGRDRSSLVAAAVLLVVTGVMWVGAHRPRIVADDAGLTIVNPLREHQVGWAAVAAIDTTDLIRVRCEWPGETGGENGQKAIYAWAAGASRRRQAVAQMRAQRRARSPRGPSIGVFGAQAPGFGAPSAAARGGSPAPEPGDADKIVATLTARADEARASAPESVAARPVSTWYWPAFAAVGIPLLALLIAIVALSRGRRSRVRRLGAQRVDVVGGRACLDRRIDEDGHVPCGRQAALVGVEHVEPGERVPVQGLHANLQLPVVAQRHAVPGVELLLVDLGDVVEHDEDALVGGFHHGGERPVPADVLAAECQAPALEPPGAPLRGVRAARGHLRRIHVAAVGGV